MMMPPPMPVPSVNRTMLWTALARARPVFAERGGVGVVLKRGRQVETPL